VTEWWDLGWGRPTPLQLASASATCRAIMEYIMTFVLDARLLRTLPCNGGSLIRFGSAAYVGYLSSQLHLPSLPGLIQEVRKRHIHRAQKAMREMPANMDSQCRSAPLTPSRLALLPQPDPEFAF
jgi:hypothetical protein